MSNRQSNWNFPPDLLLLSGLPILVAVFISSISFKLIQVDGYAWIWFIGISLSISIIGASLILKAKMPLYQNGEFFTFGAGSIPPQLKRVYLWGIWITAIGCFSAGLLLVGAYMK